MALHCMTGRAGAVREAVGQWLGRALAGAEEGAVILLVPAQFTLQAELDALEGLDLPGSFRLQVFSPERLYARIFQQAGAPDEVRVDEQGRVMLMHSAARSLRGELTWYKSAVARPGFAERAVRQIAQFKQAGLAPGELRELAGGSRKLSDLALLYEAYEALLKGRFMDGEDEARRAVERMPSAALLKSARVCAYGFDLITPTLALVLVALSGCTLETRVALALASDPDARDFPLYAPVARSLERMIALAQGAGQPVSRERLKEPDVLPGALRHLERELFCAPAVRYEGEARNVQLALLRNPRDEAEFVAALARRLARKQGYRYRDMAVALAAPDEDAANALRRAFALYDVPLFLASGRPADRHPLAIFLLSALRLVTRGYQMPDMALYIRSGFSGLTEDEADRMLNYALARGLRARRWLRPLTWGEPEEIEQVEPLRARLVAPLEALAERGRAASSTREALSAVYHFLEEASAYEALEAQRRALEGEGLNEWAMEGAQVWNRVLEALDQMDELLSGEALKLRDVQEMLRRALSAALVKALPQAGDAVEGGSLDHLKGKPVKALFVVGASDAGAEASEGLLDDRELSALSEEGFWRLTQEDRSRMRRLSLKSLLALTEKYLLVSLPMSDGSGRATQPGSLVLHLRMLLPNLRERGGLEEDEQMRTMRLEQPDAALARLPERLRAGDSVGKSALRALRELPEAQVGLGRIERAMKHRVYSEPLDPALSRAVCGPLSQVSASRLERFALCPFRHFAHYALRPEEFHPFELSLRDAGSFYHEALEAFIARDGERLSQMRAEEGGARMDEITQELIGRVLDSAAGDSAVAAAEAERMRAVARRAAAIITRQFDGSQFRPACVEAEVGEEGARVTLKGAAALAGRIDRVDEWSAPEGLYLRVIDYKTGGRTVSLQEIYYGLQLQLIIYLAAVLRQRGGKAAGVFYFGVKDPLLATEERDPALVEAAREKELRLDGLVLKDERVVAAMAADPEQAINVAFKKDGALRASDKLLEEADFDRLIAHALKKAEQMLEQMRAGDTSIAPAQISGRMACGYCEYRAVCQYDEHLPGAAPRRLKKLSAGQVLCALSAEDSDP